jgi:GNAT superfamily N-acetyltransferase
MENARFWRESLRRVGVVVQFAFARVAGEPVGFVFTTHQPHGVASLGVKRGGIWSIGVLKPWRGRGIASGLIIHGMHWLRRLGMDDVELWVDDMNVTRARGVYERLGFGPAYRSLAYRRDMAAP